MTRSNPLNRELAAISPSRAAMSGRERSGVASAETLKKQCQAHRRNASTDSGPPTVLAACLRAPRNRAQANMQSHDEDTRVLGWAPDLVRPEAISRGGGRIGG